MDKDTIDRMATEALGDSRSKSSSSSKRRAIEGEGSGSGSGQGPKPVVDSMTEIEKRFDPQ